MIIDVETVHEALVDVEGHDRALAALDRLDTRITTQAEALVAADETLKAAWAEIERLTAELAETEAVLHASTELQAEYKAERNRLLAEVEELRERS